MFSCRKNIPQPLFNSSRKKTLINIRNIGDSDTAMLNNNEEVNSWNNCSVKTLNFLGWLFPSSEKNRFLESSLRTLFYVLL